MWCPYFLHVLSRILLKWLNVLATVGHIHKESRWRTLWAWLASRSGSQCHKMSFTVHAWIQVLWRIQTFGFHIEVSMSYSIHYYKEYFKWSNYSNIHVPSSRKWSPGYFLKASGILFKKILIHSTGWNQNIIILHIVLFILNQKQCTLWDYILL